MKPWAAKVEQLQIRCPECRRIARRILRGESFTSSEKAHLEHDVTAVEAARTRTREWVWVQKVRSLLKTRRIGNPGEGT